jgi:hypothetical protein
LGWDEEIGIECLAEDVSHNPIEGMVWWLEEG